MGAPNPQLAEPSMGQAFDQAYTRYSGMLFKLSMVYLHDRAEAEDVMQEVFVKLLAKPPRFAGPEHEKRWLLRVAVNLCKDRLRSGWRVRTVSLEDQPEPPSAEQAGYSYMAELIFRLPDKYKGPIHLYYYEEYSVREISEILHISQPAVKMRLKRGRDMLKLEWEESE